MPGSSSPRVLILSPFVMGYTSGSGSLLANLFCNWPKDKLAQLHSSAILPNQSNGENFYRLRAQDVRRPVLFRGREYSSLGVEQASEETKIAGFPLGRKIKDWLKNNLVGNSGLPQKFSPSPALLQWLDQFQPELIYTILGPIPYLEAILFIQERYQTKLVVHCMDDWYEDAYTTGIFSFQRKKMKQLFHSILHKANTRIAISEKMAEVFQEKFALPFSTISNGIFVDDFVQEIQQKKQARAKESPPKLLYYGSILPFAQLDTLLALANILDQLSLSGEMRPELEIFTTAGSLATHQKKFAAFQQTRLQQMSGNPAEFSQELAKADCLVLPINFDEETIHYVRYSLPAKTPGYLASGTPILLIGPKSVYQTQYALKEGWAYCITESEPSLWREKIRNFLLDSSLQEQLVKNALRVAHEKHDLLKVRATFQEMIGGTGA